jgi:hypothetical protein
MCWHNAVFENLYQKKERDKYDYQIGTNLYGRWGKKRIFGNPGWKIYKFQRRSAGRGMDRLWKKQGDSWDYRYA